MSGRCPSAKPRLEVSTASRLHKDGETWKRSDSFGRDDLLLVAKVADQAHSWIFEQNQQKEAAPEV
jgi:hypothetical protein